jgi:glycosyltransferase involved in cell wall biosynthesis
MFIDMPRLAPRLPNSEILYLSSLESRKGPRLAIRALAETPEDVHLAMVGDGPERRALQRLARRLDVSDRVRFLGHVGREKVFELLNQAAAVVFTSLREEGGVALAEAMLVGAPVIVLANGGTRTTAASTTAPEQLALIQPAGVGEVARRMGEAMTRFSRNPPSTSGPALDQEGAKRLLREIFQEAMAPRA